MCLIAFTLLVAIFSFAFINQSWFVTLIGYLSLGTEALMAVPQLLSNYKNKSVYGLRYVQHEYSAVVSSHINGLLILICGCVS
jgi:hypothetical protein